jgi:hypothetical protein
MGASLYHLHKYTATTGSFPFSLSNVQVLNF